MYTEDVEKGLLTNTNAEGMQELFMQTAAALSSAIDAKDRYTQGHSERVAMYAKRIAELVGMSEDAQTEVYYAGLLHDVGKIGVKDSIINKEGKLTKEEFDVIKTHASMGYEILKKITRMPFLSIGAHYHHERYDGKGYPDGLKGEEIPLIARIISVADAYDAMTSKRSYRDIIPQWTVREQIVEGLGTQFDPEFGRCMIYLIDQDSEYTMQEMLESARNAMKRQRHYKEYGTNYSAGQQITENTTYVRMIFKENLENLDGISMPSFIFYDSNDTRIPEDENRRKEMNFAEFMTVRADGLAEGKEIRNLRVTRLHENEAADECFIRNENNEAELLLEMVKYKDHLRVRLDSGNRKTEYIAALPDSTRYVYVTITGANCDVEILNVEKDEKPIDQNEIPRIAEELDFRFGPEGDIPSIQMNSWREVHSESIKLEGSMRISMHSLSLPTSRLIWHCPFMIFYVSDDNKFWGENYKEIAMLRMDGEYWSGYNLLVGHKQNNLPEFEGWDKWKEKNKAGVDCELTIEKQGNVINIRTCNSGLEAYNRLVVPEEFGDVYMTLTGDQCAITDIRIHKN